MWNDPDLTAHERLTALAFAKYAGAGMDAVWVERGELVRITGMSRSKAIQCVRALELGGWLVLVQKARQHSSSRYRLCIPVRGALPAPLSESRGATHDARGPRHDAQGSTSWTQTTRTTTPNPKERELAIALEGEGLTELEIDRVMEISSESGSTSPVGRLLSVPHHRAECIAQLRDEHANERRSQLDAEPRCFECGKPESLCRAAEARVACEHGHNFSERTGT